MSEVACLLCLHLSKIENIALQLPSKKIKPWINYLLIVLGFMLLALAIYLFFKFRIKAIEKENTSVYQRNGKTNLECMKGGEC